MRFVKTGAIALALAGSTLIGAGAAHADQTITVTTQVLNCAIKANLSAAELVSLGSGGTVTVSDSLAAKLKTGGCL